MATKYAWRVRIGSDTYTQNGGLFALDFDFGVFSEAVAVGCVQARQVVIELEPVDDIPRRAAVEVFCQPENSIYLTDPNMGTYYISRREKIGNRLRLTCYCPVLKLEGNYFADGEEIGEWPRNMLTVAEEICERIGMDIDYPTGLPTYTMEAPAGLTMREVMGQIAAAYGGNWVSRHDGSLYLLPLWETLGNYTANNNAQTLTAIGDPVTYDGVLVYWSDTDAYAAGDTSEGAKVLAVDCQWGTQTMADNIWADLDGVTFQGFQASGAWLTNEIEPGYQITIGGLTSQIITMTGSAGPAFAADISFPGQEVEEDEYPYEGATARAVSRKVSLGRAYYGTTISRERGLVISRSDGNSETIFNSDTLSMRAKDPTTGQMVDCIYFDSLAQRYRITGLVEIDGAMIAESMYADTGEIADLTVSRVLTSRRIALYLNQDTGRDNYVSVQDNEIALISASVKMDTDGTTPLTEQLTNDSGQALYWAGDITEAEVVDGHYEIDGTRVPVTTAVTDWPVMVYQYSAGERTLLTFGGANESYAPVIVLGNGIGDGDKGKAKIRKATDGLVISYLTSAGDELQIKMTDGGRIVVTDTLSGVDLTQEGKMIMTYDGSAGAVEYGLTETSTGLRLTTPEGQVIDIATQ